MATSQSKEFLDPKAIITITILTALWGFNYTAIKFTNEGIAPVFASTLRSLIASICGVIYCLHQKQKLFHTDIMLFHGFMVGLLFGLEFACIYFGMLYTDAARSVVFVYTSPFVVAIGAHLFIRGDRLSVSKDHRLDHCLCGHLYRVSRKTQGGKGNDAPGGRPPDHGGCLLGSNNGLHQEVHGREDPPHQYVSVSAYLLYADFAHCEPDS